MADVRVPAEVSWLVELVGRDTALALVSTRGGTRLFVPLTLTRNSMLAREIGFAKARLLAQALAGKRYWKVPACKRWRVQVLSAKGRSIPVIARNVGLDESTVERYLAHARPQPQQMLLPLA